MGQPLSCPTDAGVNDQNDVNQVPAGDPAADAAEGVMRDPGPGTRAYWELVGNYWWDHWYLSLSNAMAWYEFSTFINMEPWISEKFFGGSNAFTWAAFAGTFICQSMGGYVVGSFADRFGRRPAMLGTVATMFLATTGQGLAPEVPIIGTSWVIVCQILQGLASGGELGTVTVYTAETMPNSTLSMSGLVVSTAVSLGQVLSTFVAFVIVKIFNPDQMSNFAWRLPFMFAGLPMALSLYYSWDMEESQDFEDAHAGPVEPVDEAAEGRYQCMKEDENRALMEYWPQGLLAIAGVGSSFAQQYLAGGYLEEWLINSAGYPNSRAMGVLLFGQIGMVIASVPFAALGDAIGCCSLMLYSSIAAATFSVPMFWALHQFPSSTTAMVVAGCFAPTVLQGMAVAANPWCTEMFPTEVRAAAVSFYYNLGQALGGCAPLICNLVGGPLAPGWYSLLNGVISAIANWYCIQLHRQYLKTGKGMCVGHIRDEPY